MEDARPNLFGFTEGNYDGLTDEEIEGMCDEYAVYANDGNDRGNAPDDFEPEDIFFDFDR